MELTGKISALFDTKQIKSSFRKRELVLVTDERYPQKILVEFVQDKIDLLDDFHEGDEVRIAIDIRGREWTSPRGETKYFVSIQGWRIEALDASRGAGAPGDDAPPFDDVPPPESPDEGGAVREDDIPF
jgi:hypothetical protein